MRGTQCVVLVGLALSACRPDASDFTFGGRNPGGLSAVIAADRTEFSLGDSITFWVFLVNDGPPRMVDNHPRNFGLSVFSESGQLTPRVERSVDEPVAGRTLFTLPGESTIGRMVDVGCVRVLYGDLSASCLYGYTLREVGQYRIEAGFAVPRLGAMVDSDGSELDPSDYELVGDSITIRVTAR